MLNTEVAAVMNDSRAFYEIAAKDKFGVAFNAEDKERAAVIDAWARKIGETGADSDREIAAFIVKVIEPIMYNYPDQLLDAMFDRGSIGEFDDTHVLVNPKNTLKVYDAAKGGNVLKSFIDYNELMPTWHHKQVETDIRYTDLRKNGFKTVSSLTMFAEEALKNAMFRTVFDAVDSLITLTNTSQYIGATGATLTQTDMDALNLYLIERSTNPFIVCRSGDAQQLSRMSGQVTFMSEEMKNNFNRYGLVQFFNGVRIAHIPSAIQVNDTPALPNKKVFGFANKIGLLDMRGDLRIYEDFDNQSEKVNLKITGFEFGYVFTRPEFIAKLVLL